MPIELESANLQLIDGKIAIYLPAAALIAKALFDDALCWHDGRCMVGLVIEQFLSRG
jgi:hypothetical protein